MAKHPITVVWTAGDPVPGLRRPTKLSDTAKDINSAQRMMVRLLAARPNRLVTIYDTRGFDYDGRKPTMYQYRSGPRNLTGEYSTVPAFTLPNEWKEKPLVWQRMSDGTWQATDIVVEE